MFAVGLYGDNGILPARLVLEQGWYIVCEIDFSNTHTCLLVKLNMAAQMLDFVSNLFVAISSSDETASHL